MGRRSKPVIAINKESGERKVFECVFECAHAFGVSNSAVLVAVARGTSVKGWYRHRSAGGRGHAW